MDDQYLYSGLIRLHVLHHAVHEPPVFGLGIIEELGRHGYRLSPGTMYPILHGLESKGYLKSREEREGKRLRRVYRATAKGRKALDEAKEKVRELFGELLEDDLTLGAHDSERPRETRPRGVDGASDRSGR